MLPMGVCERGVNERPRSAETPPKTKATEIIVRLYKTMLPNTCRRLRSRIRRVMEAGVNRLGEAGCRYTKEYVWKISGQYIHFHRSYDVCPNLSSAPCSPNWTCKLVTFHRMWPRKYGWLNFAILECSLNVWIVNKIVFAAPELCESALPNPKFLLHCRKWHNINLSWRKFQTSISSTLRKIFE